jgi:hypothetical protein
MSDFDQRDPFPDASVPEAGAAPEPAASSAAPSRNAAAEPLAGAAAEAGAPEASTAPEPAPTPAPEASADVPPSEAPTIPMIPVERLRFHTAAPEMAPETAAAAEPTSTATAPAPAVPAAPVPRVSPPTHSPARPAGPASMDVIGSVVPPAARDLSDRRQPLYRECRGYRLRLDPPDLARLRELPGSRGKSDDEIGEAFFDGQADRLAASIADDVPTPSEIRVVVDPYSRQAFLALENRIRGILSF